MPIVIQSMNQIMMKNFGKYEVYQSTAILQWNHNLNPTER